MKRLSTLFRLILLVTLLAGCSGAPTPQLTRLPAQPTATVPQVTGVPALPTATVPPTASPTPNAELAKLLKQSGAPAPVVLQTAVTKVATDAEAGGAIEVSFDQPMNPDTTTSALQVTGPDGKAVTGKVTWPAPKVLHFAPEQALQPGSTYQVRLKENATSAGGVALKDALRLTVSTEDALNVAQVFPANGTDGVATDSVITVLFNCPVVPLRIAEEQSTLPQPLRIDPPLEGKGEWVNTSVYIYHPAQPLKGDINYSVTISSGLAPADGTGAPLPADYAWSFHTMSPSVDWLKIRLSADTSITFGDQNSSMNVALNPQFSLHFFQPMDRASTSAALTLNAKDGASVPLNLTWSDDNRSLDFTPANRLALDTIYNLNLGTSALSTTGAPLGKAEQWPFRTVPYPAILDTAPVNGATNADTAFAIHFASPMNLKSVWDHVVFDPPLENKEQHYYDDAQLKALYYGLKSSTTYQVRLQAGMTDLYGNAIQNEQVVRFTTQAQSPQAWLLMPDQALFRPGSDQSFYTRLVNVHTVHYSLYRLSLEQFAYVMQSGSLNYRPASTDLVWKQDYQNEAAGDQAQLAKLSIKGPNGQDLPKGLYLLEMDTPDISHPGMPFVDSRVLSVSDANLMFKVAPNEALAWVTDLASGKPVSGADVKVYQLKTDNSQNSSYEQAVEGKSDANGLAHLDLPAVVQTQEYYQSPNYIAVVNDEAHFAYANSDWGAGVSNSDFGIWAQYYEPPTPDMVYVYTERPIYRPGQPVYFKGILRQDDDLHYTLPAKNEVEVVIHSFDQSVADEKLPVSDWGTFNGSFTLDSEAALGTYWIEVKYPGEKSSIGSVSFNVAEYRRPEFQVKLDVAPANVLAGEQFSVNLKAGYYSGGGVSKAKVDWTLRSAPFNFTPPAQFGRYSFVDSDRDVYYDAANQPAGQKADNLLADGSAVTDDQGRLTLTLPAKLKTDASQRLVLETTVTDFAGTAVSGSTEVVAHRSAVYPGVRFDGYIGTAGQQQTIDLAALDWDGKPVAGQLVDVQVVERRWHSVQEQDERGNLKWTSTVEEIPVTEFKGVQLGADGKGSVSFTPPNGGVFKAKVTARDTRGNAATASDMIWVAGADFIPWRQTNDRSFQLVTDKTEYQPGDTAEVLIASPFQGEAYALVTVERGRIRKQEVLKLESNSTLYKLPVTGDMAPNVYLSVVVVKGVDANNPRPNFKIGMTEISVATDQQALKVTVQADPPNAGPGDQVNYTVQTTDISGQPVQAEVSLGLSDLATLSLAPANSPTLMKGFYDRRGLRVRTAMALVNSAEDYNADIEEHARSAGQGMGSGGGKGQGDLGVIAVRQDFPDTAYWKADVRTDASGKAQITVRLPDNLTTWRMDARAVTQDTRVGQTTGDLVSSKPLLLRPQTPRFFIAGDQAALGAAVHNNTTENLTVSVRLEGTGITIDGAAEQKVEISAGQQAYVSWQTHVPADAQKVDVTFSASGTGAAGKAYTDASKPTIGSGAAAGSDGQNGLPVYRYEAPETVAASGQLTEAGSLAEAIQLPATMPVTQGELSVSVAPSLAASLTDGLTYLKEYPYGCTEQTVSGFLPNVLVTRVLREAGQSDPTLEANLKTQVNEAMQHLASWQQANGGWGWWKEGKTDEQISAYAVLGLIEARDAGYDIPTRVLENGLSYLSDHVGGLPDSLSLDLAGKTNRQAFILYVLARANHSDPSLVGRLYDDRLKLDLYARALLTRAIALQDAGDPRLNTLRSDFANAAVVSASGTHWEEAQADVWNWNSDTRTTAIVLGTLVQTDPKNPLVANAVRWLMSHPTNGRWSNTQETAWTLMALADWIRASGELKADYSYAVGLNDKTLAEGKVTPETIRQTQTMKVQVADMLKDSVNKLVFARDSGQGNLYYTANLKVYLPVPQIQALDRGIILTREYYRPDDPNTPVTQAKQGDLLRVRLTVIAPKALHYVAIDDPLPAGLEGVDTSLQTSPQGEQPEAYRWSDVNQTGWGWWYFDHIQMRDEKVTFSSSYLPAGTYVFTYLARASTPGVYNVIPPTGQEFYFPEVYGRGNGMAFEVK